MAFRNHGSPYDSIASTTSSAIGWMAADVEISHHWSFRPGMTSPSRSKRAMDPSTGYLAFPLGRRPSQG